MIYTIKYKLNVTKQFVQRATSINTIRGRKNGYRMASRRINIWLKYPYGWNVRMGPVRKYIQTNNKELWLYTNALHTKIQSWIRHASKH